MRPKQRRRLARQPEMTLPEMLEDLPRACAVGVKQGAKGHQESWVGYKLHLDVADGAIPVSCLLTSASLHDSQAAIPLATLTAARVTNLYDPGSSPGQALMDSAYDAPEIRTHSESLGHVAIIDVDPRKAARKLERKTEAKRNAVSATCTTPNDAIVSARRSSGSTVASKRTSAPAKYACVGMLKACPQLDWGCCVT